MKYVVARIGQAAIVMFAVTTAMFFLVRTVPGNPAAVIAGPDATPATLAAVTAEYHLNRPVLVQYWDWLAGIVTGHLGMSLTYREPVSTLIGQNVLPTVELLVAALILGLGLGVGLGILAATHRRRPADVAVSWFTSGVLGIPAFWVGLLLLLVFAVDLRWVPSGGWANVFTDPSRGFATLALPAGTLGLGIAAVQARFVRSAMIDALEGDYVRTARAKGVGERSVVWRHALRNALLPVVTITGIQVGALLGGAVVIEEVFTRPGLGTLVVEAIANRDYPLVQGVILVLVAAFSAVNLLTDLLYRVIDPRIRR